MADYQRPRVPEFAPDLNPDIVQLHSSQYRNPSQLQPGDVLLVGAGNSGAEIAMEVSGSHRTWLSGRDTGQIPFRMASVPGRFVLAPLVLRLVFHRLLTLRTPMGRRARAHEGDGGGPRIRTRTSDLAAAGVTWVPRTAGVRDGRPVLEDGRVLDVANVIWCTGYHPGFSWIELPVFGEHGPEHERGVVAKEPGLYFTGLDFLYAFSSIMVQGAGRDADHIAKAIAARVREREAEATRHPAVQIAAG
jgi:putative flavoprotein involved in K+ transport